MGLSESKISLPSEKIFYCSYCKQDDYKFTILKEYVDLINLINIKKIDFNYIVDFINKTLYYKIKNLGYSIKETPTSFINTKEISLKQIIENICERGFFSSDKTERLTDIIIKPICYKPTLNNIKGLLSDGNILIAGIIIDDDFNANVLNNQIVIRENVSDIIIIIGYNENNISVLSNWYEEPFFINNKFVSNIIEIWNIEINSPED